MTVERMEHVGIVVDDLEAATAFFAELGLERQGGGQVEGEWVDRVVGLDGIEVEFAMMETPDGGGRLELVKFQTPPSLAGDPQAPAHPACVISRSEWMTSTRSSSACDRTVPRWSARWSSTRICSGSATSAARLG